MSMSTKGAVKRVCVLFLSYGPKSLADHPSIVVSFGDINRHDKPWDAMVLLQQ